MKKDIESQSPVSEGERRGLLKYCNKQDVLAGITVGVMAIPQGMAYAMLADLPPIYGLYTSLVPATVYAFFGDSKQLHVGPVSMVSLITAAAIKKADITSTSDKVLIAAMLALVAGLSQVLMGVFRLGSLVSYATLPIISGFTAGASVVVIVAQSQHVFGISVKSGATTLHTAYATVNHLVTKGFDTYSLGLGIVFLAALWFAKSLAARHPGIPALKAAGPLFVVGFGTAVTHLLRLDGHGVKIIGDVPTGLPSLTPVGDVFGKLSVFAKVMDSGLAIGFISFMESIAVAKTLAHRNGYELDANKELMALGGANIAGFFFSSYASAGAFSRSAVASETGAQSQAAAVFASLVVAVTLIFLTPLFYFLPKGVLAAIVIHAVWGLIKVSDLTRLVSICKRDAALWVVAFLGTLYSVNVGLLTAIFLSIIFLVKDTAHPLVERLGKLTHGQNAVYVPVSKCPDSVTDPDVLVIGISGLLHGGGAEFLKSQLLGIHNEHQAKRGVNNMHLVIDMSHVTSLDTTALRALFDTTTAMVKGTSKLLVYCGLSPDMKSLVEDANSQVDGTDTPKPALMQTVPEAVSSLSEMCVHTAKMRSASAAW